MRYRLAIFDFDGTLADSFPWFLAVVNEAAERYRFRRIEPEDVAMLRGHHARRVVQHVGLSPWKMPRVASWMRRRMAEELDSIELFPGVDGMLRGLSDAGVRLAVVTSNSEENVRRVLGPDLAARFRHWGCGSSIFGKGPRLRRVLAECRLRPEEAICIGDELRDLSASRSAGIPFGAVLWGYTLPEALREGAPEEVFASVEDILNRLA